MKLYSLTISNPTGIQVATLCSKIHKSLPQLLLNPHIIPTQCAVYGNFSGPKSQEIVASRGKVLELLRPDADGRMQVIYSTEVFGAIRALSPFRLTGANTDYIIIGSDSGRIVIIRYDKTRAAFVKVHQETFGKSGCRRIVPGQMLAIDPKGRACMIGALEKQKFVYILNRDAAANLTISSPLEAHKSHTLVFDIVGLDQGFDNPVFAAIELDYSESDQVGCGGGSGWWWSWGGVGWCVHSRLCVHAISNPTHTPSLPTSLPFHNQQTLPQPFPNIAFTSHSAQPIPTPITMQDPTGEAALDAQKHLTLYEMDLGLNHVVRKSSEPVENGANKLVAVPGGGDGPGGVLVCCENFVLYRVCVLFGVVVVRVLVVVRVYSCMYCCT